jgi:hypothetical protein
MLAQYLRNRDNRELQVRHDIFHADLQEHQSYSSDKPENSAA